MSGAGLKGIHERVKRIGNEISPYRAIVWLVLLILGAGIMTWTFIRDWFFPVFAFAVVGGQVLWAAASLVLAFRRPKSSWSGGAKTTTLLVPSPLEENTNIASSDTEETKLLLGSWTVYKNTPAEPNYLAVWDFAADGKVKAITSNYNAEGTWTLHQARVLIQWDNPLNNGDLCYDTLHRPLSPTGTGGDSWGGRDGLDKVWATKLASSPR